MNPHNIPMPYWVKLRLMDGWQYMGVIGKNLMIPFDVLSFEELVEEALRSDHGEIREADYYPEGAACWVKEVENV